MENQIISPTQGLPLECTLSLIHSGAALHNILIAENIHHIKCKQFFLYCLKSGTKGKATFSLHHIIAPMFNFTKYP